jgi:hypothetical protein
MYVSSYTYKTCAELASYNASGYKTSNQKLSTKKNLVGPQGLLHVSARFINPSAWFAVSVSSGHLNTELEALQMCPKTQNCEFLKNSSNDSGYISVTQTISPNKNAMVISSGKQWTGTRVPKVECQIS